MPTVSRNLPDRPHLDVPKREARELLSAWRRRESDALDRIRRRHPRFHRADDAMLTASAFRLADAQLVIAREYGSSDWPELKQRVQAHAITARLGDAVQADDRETVVRLLRKHPNLLHVPVWSGNWGPPMSHAANLGRLEIIKEIAALGARDVQHAFDRAVLQGQLECARWRHEHGAKLSAREIYPPELGCAEDGRSGMHGPPLDGTTLLHVAIDFDEQEIFDLLLASGADVNARATIDEAGFGGHTPLFNAVVSSARACGRQRDARLRPVYTTGPGNPRRTRSDSGPLRLTP